MKSIHFEHCFEHLYLTLIEDIKIILLYSKWLIDDLVFREATSTANPVHRKVTSHVDDHVHVQNVLRNSGMRKLLHEEGFAGT